MASLIDAESTAVVKRAQRDAAVCEILSNNLTNYLLTVFTHNHSQTARSQLTKLTTER